MAETIIDWLTLALAGFVGPVVVFAILRPWGDNWRDRPIAVGSTCILSVMTWSGLAGFGTPQTWDSHTRILAVVFCVLWMVAWIAAIGRRRP